MEKLYLTDLIDGNILQRIQDAFSDMSGFAALTTDNEGRAVTVGSNFTDFCVKYTRQSKVGCARCELCDKSGAEWALEEGKAVAYRCHAGLVDFAAPIMARNQLVGCFVGGQVLTEEPDFEKFRKIAEDIEVDPDEYIEALKKVPVVEKEKMERAAEFLYTTASVFSDIAYGKYQALKASEDLEKVANMKSDFLANMSHEIRTPMNAVIGMAEMALREELPPAARDYIKQIQSSGKALLTIINDILDFSKIESGKMDINMVEYEPMTIINDVSNIIMTRIGDKDIELVLDIVPDMPKKLYGDNIRIKQIIVNLANNAVKFTQSGQVLLKLQYEREENDWIKLKASIKDTGIGIKKKDLGKLFQSFQQVDSKRNRNIEGTGLGLAISKQLLTLMGGDIGVTSEYEKGSEFTFELPQKIFDDTPSISLEEKASKIVVDMMSNTYVCEQLKKDTERLGAEYIAVSQKEELQKLCGQSQNVTLFMEQKDLTQDIEEFLRENPEMTGIVLVNFNTTIEYPIENLLVMKKPLYVWNLAMVLNHEELVDESVEDEEEEFNFIAPSARILIVDDNAINLTVAEGLLKPLRLRIDTVTSGKEAIRMISIYRYDLIFMDHMMPDMDGVETTRIIRRFHEEYDDIPIIALTANAVSGTKELFLREGMNDFVAKPIELQVINSKLRTWLPQEKIQKVQKSDAESGEGNKQEELPVIQDLDTGYAMRLLGSETLFWKVLKDYYHVIRKKVELIKKLEQEEEWSDYTVEVHALKSASRQIGALALADEAEAMEEAGNNRNVALIHERTDGMLEKYLSYEVVLAEYFPEEEKQAVTHGMITEELLDTFFKALWDAFDNLDMDRMEEIAEELKKYEYSSEQEREFIGKLLSAMNEMDIDTCEELLNKWESRR